MILEASCVGTWRQRALSNAADAAKVQSVMSTNYQYHSIEIENFRSFKKLSLPKLKRINLFGGFNGVGKTSLLETIFFTMDIPNPIAILKPYLWRGVVAREEDDLFFFLNDRENDAKITTIGARGQMKATIKKSPTPSEALAARNANSRSFRGEMGTTGPLGRFGLEINAKWRSEEVRSFIFPDGEGYSGSVLHSTNPQLPQSIIVSSAARSSSNDIATRLSKIIKSRRMDSVIEPLKMFQPDLRSFTILQYGQEQVIYADVAGDLYSINMLGDGFKNLFEVILAMSVANGGCVFLDEVDAAFHYSIVGDAWRVISEAANRENCQVFATSHSRETILSAAKGVEAAGREKDFTYGRLSKVDEQHIVTSYNISELDSADEFNIEFR